MGDINYYRYCDSIGVSGWNKKTFLNQWYRKWMNKFNDRFKEEWECYNTLSSVYYQREVDNGRHGMDVVGDAAYKNIEKIYSPINRHKLAWWLVEVPHNIEHWLCCGWKLYYDREMRHWTYIDKYHMMSKLCRYGHPWWPNYKFTWWDKLRFKWITGYKYEEQHKRKED